MMNISKRLEVEKDEKWYDIWKDIPSIKFDPNWEVQIIPPFAGATVRFRVNGHVSVYLDHYERLGCVNEPYWEVHPVEGDCERLLMSESTDELVAIIRRSLREVGKE